ncbi:CBS domain-containing protein [Paenibacillus thermoaerophilus]|uniref:CBS domain-containing protein n=1 Tax=Paenibacillus thermoaerophilus TaxID=1215385 RepID=A0ABW2V7X4_9BACL|nr:CBS domain-containing protein [Paenibacillus thermoaerophilus]TMV16129.1 CBS domain-containing protein [Paenibacillus thermoaerophilus]
MNIAFFLLPKQEVAYVSERATLRQTIEKMEHHRFTAVPVLTDTGEYVATVTEGDLLWYMKDHPEVNFDNVHQKKLSDVPLRMRVQPVRIDSQISDLISLAKVQNFVPVVDDQNKFIGIVRRSDILDYCADMLRELQPHGRGASTET